MKNLIITVCYIAISSISFSQEMKIYQKDNYSIKYPVTWEYRSEKPEPGIKFVIMAEETSQKEDLFRENINLTSESLRGQKISLNEYVQLSLSQIKSQISTAKILTQKFITLDGRTASAIEWSAEFGNNMRLRFKQYTIINGNTAYILTFSSSNEEYGKYVEDGTQILNSFKFIN